MQARRSSVVLARRYLSERFRRQSPCDTVLLSHINAISFIQNMDTMDLGMLVSVAAC